MSLHNINILTWDSISYSDLLIVSLARMRGNYSFGLALNQSVIIVFVAMNILLEGAISLNPSFSQVNFNHRSENWLWYWVSVQAVGKYKSCIVKETYDVVVHIMISSIKSSPALTSPPLLEHVHIPGTSSSNNGAIRQAATPPPPRTPTSSSRL